MAFSITEPQEKGRLGLFQLKRFWSQQKLRISKSTAPIADEYIINRVMCDALGVGIHQILEYIFIHDCSFESLEDWIEEIAGYPDPITVERFNSDLISSPAPSEIQQWLTELEAMEPVLSDDDLSFWHKNGYIVVKQAVSLEACQQAESAIWQHIKAEPDQPSSWASANTNGIMVELIQHPRIDANRRSLRIHKAFSQLWGTTNLWVSADRCGFNVPEHYGIPFQGPDLHWDLDFSQPQSFCTQGILYLTDTPAEQGATTLVPGFHHKLVEWLQALPDDFDMNNQRDLDLHALGSMPVAGEAGDLLIWHHGLPHGSRPNTGDKPRIVQYINMYPLRDYQQWMKIKTE